MEKMKLEKGKKYNLKMLAIFFEKSYTTILKNKDKHYTLLRQYVDFEKEGLNVVIIEVYQDTYEKDNIPFKVWLKEAIKELYTDGEYYYGCGARLYEILEERMKKWRKEHGLKENITKKYGAKIINRVCDELFGEKEILKLYKYLPKEEQEKLGTKFGIRFKTMTIKDKDMNYRPLTKEDWNLFFNFLDEVNREYKEEIIEREEKIKKYFSHYPTKENYEKMKDEYEKMINPIEETIKRFNAETGLTLIPKSTAYQLRVKK